MLNWERIGLLAIVLAFWTIAGYYGIKAGLYAVGETVEQATAWKSAR